MVLLADGAANRNQTAVGGATGEWAALEDDVAVFARGDGVVFPVRTGLGGIPRGTCGAVVAETTARSLRCRARSDR